jgi:hypothetical protein
MRGRTGQGARVNIARRSWPEQTRGKKKSEVKRSLVRGC